MNDIKILEKMQQERFCRNNGRVLRAINVLRAQYVPLSDLRIALSDEIAEPDFIDSVNYLYEIGYIKTRDRNTKNSTSLADSDIKKLESKLSALGIQFLTGKIDDVCVSR